MVSSFAALVTHAGGCAQFTAADPSGPGAASADAMRGGDGAAGDGAAVDGAAGDAAAGDAAAGDAGCTHDFCADFEGPQPVTGWADVKTGGGGAVAIVPRTDAAGHALQSTTAASGGGVAAYGYVFEVFPGALGARVELDVNVASASLTADGELTILQFSGAGMVNESGVGVVLRPTTPSLGFYISDGNGGVSAPTAQRDLPRDRWVHVALEVRFGMPGSLKLSVDGMTAWDMPLQAALPPMPQLRVGVQRYNDATPPLAAQFDTVRVDRL